MQSDSRNGTLAAVDEILWRLWDPVVVNDAPQARDEYFGYAAGVLRLLRRGADDRAIVRHLHRLETESMGLSSTTSIHRLQAVLSALRQVA